MGVGCEMTHINMEMPREGGEGRKAGNNFPWFI
jgi:hypothetical protein